MFEATTKLRPREAAQFLRIALSTLAKMRKQNDGPNYSRIGHRVILYDLQELEGWLEVRRVRD